MAFTLILGPMKSGKSLELIARVAPYKFADKKVLYVQPQLNVRDKDIKSRLGVGIKAQKIKSLNDITESFDVIGIDEIHMFDSLGYTTVSKWLKNGREVFASGLDLNYQGKMIPIIKHLLELKPEHIVSKTAVCDVCKNYCAIYTQILNGNKIIKAGLPDIIPEDGAYVYQARCRNCFINKEL